MLGAESICGQEQRRMCMSSRVIWNNTHLRYEDEDEDAMLMVDELQLHHSLGQYV